MWGDDSLVLVVKVGEIHHQVLDHKHVRQRSDGGGSGHVLVHRTQAGHGVFAVDVHGAGAADALPARPSVGQRRVVLVFDLLQHIQHLASHAGRLTGQRSTVDKAYSLLPGGNQSCFKDLAICHHRPAVGDVHFVGLQVSFRIVIRVPAVDLELFDPRLGPAGVASSRSHPRARPAAAVRGGTARGTRRRSGCCVRGEEAQRGLPVGRPAGTSPLRCYGP